MTQPSDFFSSDERYLLVRALRTLRNDLERKLVQARRKLAGWTDAQEVVNPGFRDRTRHFIQHTEQQLVRIDALLTRLS